MSYFLFFTTGIAFGWIFGIVRGYRVKEKELGNQDDEIAALCNLYYQQGFKDAKNQDGVYGDAPLYMN